MGTTTGRSLLYKGLLVAAMFSLSAESAFAQGFRSKDAALPDSSRFYMSRLQVQMIDEAPIVTRQANPGGMQGQGQQQMRPGIPPGGLPRAGWQSYTNDIPGLSTSLPKTNNGVPPKAPPQKSGPTGMRGNTGKLANSKPKPVAPSAPAMQAYAPYKGYDPNAFGGTANNSTKSNVRGSVLHWARGHH